ncbi:winged helix-turn-helix transcriptional regulator [Nitrincola sp. MINF-07-Sa-05]|uniref:winged helix-turn-helix transcriptional regulator n=1 Tax=Nitrincola salilacus TaxID=3400273 RepID=UPI003917E474
MKRTDFSDMHCSIAQALNIVGEWWTLLILRDVFIGNHRFSGLLDSLGISRKVLTDRLETLVAEGILEQVPYDTGNRFEYHLTQKGYELGPVLLTLIAWGDKWVFKNQPPIELTHKACNQITSPQVVCSECGEPISFRDLIGEPSRHMPEDAQQRWKKLKEDHTS